MRKWLCVAFVTLWMCLALTSCYSTSKSVAKVAEPKQDKTSMFIEVEHAYTWKVVYHRDTKVMYAVSEGSYNHGTFTLLVNADGTPMLYSAE